MSVIPEVNPGRYFALLYASAAERPTLEALFGIEREVFDSLRPGLDHHVAHSRLQWWREECERAGHGGAVHPLTRALVAALGETQAKSVPQLAGLSGIVDVAIWDLASATFETRRELEAYCQRWAAAMIEPVVAASMSAAAASPAVTAAVTASPAVAPFSASSSSPGSAGSLASARRFAISTAGGSSAPADTAASAALLASAERTAAWHNLGAAIREVQLLADLAREAHHGRVRLPLDELESAKANTTVLANPPWPEAIASLMRARLTSLRSDIEGSVAGFGREQQQAIRGLLVWAALSWRTAQRVERALPNRLQPGRFDAISDSWFAWRMARRATIGRFRLS